ncbi:A disintegrin and metalloproteinase with thrombospondin motifs 16-like [Haliotis cracherodii]|uniref:A disintegrin and metalloproteinase with thrombospondin motifs 16-like n=1 Tax=Haliotis cracherodii TaxID=6455 RepID=UPI0039E8063F
MHLAFAIVVTAVLSTASAKFHESLTTEDLKHYFGTDAKNNVPEYEIVHPAPVTGSRHARKNAIPPPPLKYRLKGRIPPPPLKYRLKALGEDYDLHLEHNQHLVAPGCLVTTEGGDLETVPCPRGDCFYHGHSASHNDSTAALSTCNGLHGIISTPSHQLMIHPIRDQHLSLTTPPGYPAPTRPHIAYRVPLRKKRSSGLQAAADALVKAAPRRMRRQAGKRYIEMLIVADKTMYNYHKDDLTHYVLTAANVAATRFLDPSLGVKLYLTILKVKILKSDQAGLSIVPDAEKTLQSFCSWQEPLNARGDDNPAHWDTASLMTRVDIIYLGSESDTGLATLEGMCGNNKRCSVVEDDGLDLGLTLAHETGHTLSMHHDGEGNACADKKNIMSSGGGGGATAFKWSSCSADYVNKFLSSGQGNCLNDSPQGTTLALPQQLPGVIYPADAQCEFFVGEGSTICTGTSLVGGDECSKLVCFDPGLPGQCRGSQTPRMDGTECGNRKWCQGGQCVDIGPDGPAPQDGGWSAYSTDWTPCSRSCGGGVRYKSRKCNNPRPLFGGKTCVGQDTMAEMCNVHECPTSQLTFKKEQCSATDSAPYNGQLHHWMPMGDTGATQCQLMCESESAHFGVTRTLDGSSDFKDGTECQPKEGTYGRCVRGTCRAFGCDGVGDSGREDDQCGVCSGLGDTCSKKSGTFTKGEEHQYVTFVKIPKGATGVTITNTNVFSILSLSVGGVQVLNKGGQKAMSGTYSGAGVTVKYRRTPEKLQVVGTLSDDAEGQVYRIYGDMYAGSNPNINYEYYVSNSQSGPQRFVWKTKEGQCSVTCGEGSVQMEAMCVKADTGATVDNYRCLLADKPLSGGKPCSTPACPASWRAGSFGTCSRTCGGGTQSRQVRCMRDSTPMPDSVCTEPKPVAQQECGTHACPGEWRPQAWSVCSQTCSVGVKTRTSKCFLGNEEVPDEKCLPSDKPASTQTCLTAVCFPDMTGIKCADTKDCEGRDTSVCSDYADWSKQNCKMTCGYCKVDGDSACKDVDTAECEGHGPTVCTEYPDWAKENCANYCGCDSTGSTGSTGGSTDSCQDKDTETCKGQGASACTQYPEWAKENCAKFCNIGCKSSGTGSGGTGTGTGSVGTGSTDSCQDKDTETCKGQGASACTQYPEWAKENCAKFCNIGCKSSGTGSGGTGTGTGSVGTESGQQSVDGACKDTNEQCDQYNDQTCSQYKEWAMENCKKRCNFCTGESHVASAQSVVSSSTAAASTAASVSTTAAPFVGNCRDVLTNCAAYGTSACTKYGDWARTNCQNYCAMCGEATAVTAAPAATTTSSADPSCTDLKDCAAYGASACQTYKDWAKENCRKFCGHCSSRQEPTTAMSTTTTTIPTTQGTHAAVDGDCADKMNCASYGTGVCSQYADWATTNCKKFCGKCESKETQSTAQPVTVTTPVSDPNCKDARGDCEGYGKGTCTQYPDWAKENCQKFCGLCTAAGDPECQDKKADCAGYGTGACAQYPDWAASNCKRFCNLCDASAGSKGEAAGDATTQAVTAAKTSSADSSTTSCVDLANCAGYGADVCTKYGDWAKTNCKKFCGICGAGTQAKVTSNNNVCKDKSTDCAGYGASACTQYADWAKTNCQKYCNLC